MNEEIKLVTTAEAGKKADENPDYLNEARLSDEERKQVEAFSQQIDVTDANAVLQYGAAAQQKMADFSESALDNVRTKDLGQVGDMISSLVGELKALDFDEGDDGFFSKLFKKGRSRLDVLKSKYGKAEKSVESISEMLESHQIRLMKDIAVLDQMYERNLINFKELTMYIIAGKKKASAIRSETIPALQAKAQESGLPEDAQAANDMAALCDRFEKKLHDLELTRMVSLQMGPQIRLVQSNDTLMAEKIRSALHNTIPLWKSQMVIALGLQHSLQATKAQREVTDMTNELLRRNAENLKAAAIDTAREAERGIIDLETLQNTNRLLIETLDEVSAIQSEGRAKRHLAEVELGRIEGDLKAKLIEVRG